MPPHVEMYSSDWCPFCSAAKRLLARKGVEWTEHRVDGQPALRAEMMERSGRHTVPQIFVDGRPVGGFDDLAELDAEGRLDDLLRGGTEAPADAAGA